MATNTIKRNERDWAGQLISWIKSAIEHGTTVFEDATNDTGVKMESGRTKFPDFLLLPTKYLVLFSMAGNLNFLILLLMMP